MKPSRDLFPLSAFTTMVNGGITAEEKRRLCALFVRFVLSDFNPNIWKRSRALYQSLSSMWGHIAHFDAGGFYIAQFGNDSRRLEFFRHALDHGFYGDPDYTRVDMERALVAWIRQSDVVARLETRIAADVRARELEQLARLTEKYGPAAAAGPDDVFQAARASGRLVVVPVGAPGPGKTLTAAEMAKRDGILPGNCECGRPLGHA